MNASRNDVSVLEKKLIMIRYQFIYLVLYHSILYNVILYYYMNYVIIL